tara:strand:- start:384 stop:818 length:435 start_codon:yes stop_codon:yes gene_type:complete
MKKTILIFGLAALALTSCKKEGCNDTFAYNYDEKVKVDDGSCLYRSNNFFYFDEEMANRLTDFYQTQEIRMFIDGEKIITLNAADFSNTPVDCNNNIGPNVVRELYSEKWEIVEYTILNLNDSIIFTGDMSFIGGECFTRVLKF